MKVSSTNARDLIDKFDGQQTVIEMRMVEPYTITGEAGEHVVLDMTIPDQLSGIPFFYAVVVGTEVKYYLNCSEFFYQSHAFRVILSI